MSNVYKRERKHTELEFMMFAYELQSSLTERLTSKKIPKIHPFTFLKTRFFITETGKIIKKPCRDSITRQRRKMKKQFKLFHQGIIGYNEIRQSYYSWKGSMLRRNAVRTVRNMDKLYQNLFLKGEEK